MNHFFVSSLLLLIALIGRSHPKKLIETPVEYEQTFVSQRIVHKLDLDLIYPEKLPDHEWIVTSELIKAFSKSSFYFVIEGSKIFFLTNFEQPATLKLKVYLNSTLKPTREVRKYSKVFDIKPQQTPKIHGFNLRSSSSLEQILKSEKAILENFKNKLWKSAKPCKDCLSINYIQPSNEHEYGIGIASSEDFSCLLEKFCLFGEMPAEHLNITDFDVDRKNIVCQVFGNEEAPSQSMKTYVIYALFTIASRSMNHTQFISAKPTINFFQWPAPDN